MTQDTKGGFYDGTSYDHAATHSQPQSALLVETLGFDVSAIETQGAHPTDQIVTFVNGGQRLAYVVVEATTADGKQVKHLATKNQVTDLQIANRQMYIGDGISEGNVLEIGPANDGIGVEHTLPASFGRELTVANDGAWPDQVKDSLRRASNPSFPVLAHTDPDHKDGWEISVRQIPATSLDYVARTLAGFSLAS